MLKHKDWEKSTPNLYQPPSGGCVLKLNNAYLVEHKTLPAAFGRLCVETHKSEKHRPKTDPAAFGRLCVETIPKETGIATPATSRLRAAVC